MTQSIEKALRSHVFLIALIVIQTLVFRQWLFHDSHFTFGDVGVYTPETQKALLANALSFYTSDTGFGNINIASSSNPLLFLFGVFAFLGVNAIWSMKLIIFYPVVYGVVLSSYFLIRKLTQSSIAAFFGALVYAYSTYFLITLTGALYLSLAYALSPFLLLAFIKVLEKPSWYSKIHLSLVATLLGCIEFRVLYINLLLLGVYFLFFLFLSKKTGKEIWAQLTPFILPGCIFILLNLFWLAPLVLAGKVSSNVLFNRNLFGDSYFDTLNALALFHPWWTGEVPAIFDKQTAPFYFFLLPGIVALTLFLSQRKKILPFVVIFVLGVLLTKQSAEPFQALYLWLYKVVPGFNAFREASKFYLLSTLSCAIIIGYFLAEGKGVFEKQRWIKGLVITLLSLFLIVQIKPIADAALGTMFIPREFPQEYRVLNEFLNKDSNYYRILWFPHTSRFGTSSNIHPSVSLLLNMETNFKEFIDLSQSKFVESLSSPFNDQRFPLFLKETSVRYVVLPSNLKWDDVESPWKNIDNYTDFLDKTPYLSRVEDEYFSKHGIAVYENKRYQSHFYLSSEKPGYQNTPMVEEVDFQSVSPTKYTVSIKNLKDPRYLNFSENYHPDWRLRIGDTHWFDSVLSRQSFFPDTTHSKNDFGMNSFYLDPEALKQSSKEGQYQEHADGSIDVDITVYFHSQSYYVLGLLVSVGTFFFCTFCLLYGTVVLKNGFIKGKKL